MALPVHTKRAAAALAALATAVVLAGCSDDVPPAPMADEAIALRPFLTGFEAPILVTHAGDGSGRLFVVEQAGVVKAWDGNTATTYLDITGRVQAGGERGLLGLAFHPGFEENGRLFVHYTDRNGDTVLSEFSDDGGRGDAGSERVLLQADQPYSNHNGGMVAFGPDGMLYLALGDGGSANDPANRAQSFDNLLGKILRIDVDSAPAPIPYTIPEDNPFATRTRGAEIWAYGLRNPWRFSFDRGTGDLWIGDVGQNRYEEIDLEPAGTPGGRNYGWSRYEGDHIHDADRSAPGAVDPVAEYDHDGGHCSVTGGYVYRGADVPSLQGAYLFGDYCSGFIWTLRPGDDRYAMHRVLDTRHNIGSFGEDERGELYVVDHGGDVLKVVAA
jgi:glucose/arabinose dehydrogenase